MRRLAKYLFVFILTVCGILIAFTVFLHFVNLNPYQKSIATMAAKSIGRQIEIKGHIDINLFPYPKLILNNVSLPNANWGSEPIMASVGHVEASISFLSLFSDMIIIRSIRLDDVIILIEQNDQQISNWTLKKIFPSADTEDEKCGHNPDKIIALPLMVESADLSNITLTVRSPESTDQVYHFSSFSLQPDKSDIFILKASGELSGNPMSLNGKITSKASVVAHGSVNVELQASFGGAQLTGQLATSRLATLVDLQGTFNLSVNDIQNILKKEKIEAPLTGPLTADVTVNFDGSVTRATVTVKVEGITTTVDGSYTDKQLELSSTLTPLSRFGELFDLQGLSADALTLKSRITKSVANDFEIEQFQANVDENQLGALGTINKDGDVNVSLTLASPDLSTLLETLPTVDFNATASVLNSAEKIVVSDLAATFDKSDINGNFSICKGDKNLITANLTSTFLDLRPFSETFEPGADAKQVSSAGAAKESTEAQTELENHYVFQKVPLQLTPLERLETDAKFSVDHFYHDKSELKDVVINASVHNGHVDAKFKCASPNEGHAAGKIDLKIQDEKAIVDTVLSMSDFRVNLLKSPGLAPEEIPPISVSIELKSDGSSPRELAAATNGRILFTQGSGKINNNMMEMYSNDFIIQLVHYLNPFSQSEEFSQWDCTVISVNIVDGLATIDGMLALGEKVMIVGGGDIDLKTEKLNVKFNTKPRSGIGISADMFVAPFIKATGTIASPGIGLNKKGTLLTGTAAFATGGLSLVLQRVFHRVTAGGDHCEDVLKTVGEHTNFKF